MRLCVNHARSVPKGFNSRTPGGVRLALAYVGRALFRFQFTHPGRGATIKSGMPKEASEVSIHAPREGCDEFPRRGEGGKHVSIHAPREGCDFAPLGRGSRSPSFNSRTPGGVRLEIHRYLDFSVFGFQFTHPGRGATKGGEASRAREVGFNSRTPGGVRHADGHAT